jgi:hypothetical protein
MKFGGSCLPYLGDLVRLRPFLALHDLKLDNVALLQGFEALPLNGRVMNEDVSSAILADESVTFAVVKPLHFALKSCHFRASLIALGMSAIGIPQKKK